MIADIDHALLLSVLNAQRQSRLYIIAQTGVAQFFCRFAIQILLFHADLLVKDKTNGIGYFLYRNISDISVTVVLATGTYTSIVSGF